MFCLQQICQVKIFDVRIFFGIFKSKQMALQQRLNLLDHVLKFTENELTNFWLRYVFLRRYINIKLVLKHLE